LRVQCRRLESRDVEIHALRNQPATRLEKPVARVRAVLDEPSLEPEVSDLIANDDVHPFGQSDIRRHAMDEDNSIADAVGRGHGASDLDHPGRFDRVDSRRSSLTGEEPEDARAAGKVEHDVSTADSAMDGGTERIEPYGVRQIVPVFIDDQ
jgi:hypothetical protein